MPLSRRDALKIFGAALGSTCIVCSGLGYLATKDPDPSETIIQTPAYFFYGDHTAMAKRILVTYATRTGSTVDVAAAIGKTLSEAGAAVDVKPVKDNPSLDGYQAVVMGSAVNGAQWLPEAVEFVKNNQQALGQVQVALFCVHIMNLGADETSRKNRVAYLNSVRQLVKPADEAYFAGIGFDPKHQSWLEGWLSRVFKIGPEGDCRDWKAIAAWAESLQLAVPSPIGVTSWK